jgi:hypothetical protein
MEQILEGLLATQEKIEAYNKKKRAILQEMKSWQEETKACAEKRKAIPEEIEVVSERQKVPNEEAAVETIGALEDRYGDRHVVVGRHRQPKKRTQGDSISRTYSSKTRHHS